MEFSASDKYVSVLSSCCLPLNLSLNRLNGWWPVERQEEKGGFFTFWLSLMLALLISN